MFRATLFLLWATLAYAQLPATANLGAVILGSPNPDTGITYVTVGLNNRSFQSAHFEDVVVDISGTQIHTGPLDAPVSISYPCSADPGAQCPPPPWRYMAVQLQFHAPDNPQAGFVTLAYSPYTGQQLPVYGIETSIMVPRLGQEFLHTQTVKPNTAGQSLAIVVHKCPVAANLPVGCQ